MTRNLIDLYRLLLKHNWRVQDTKRREITNLVTVEVWLAPPPPSTGTRYILLAPERYYPNEPQDI